MIKEAIAAINLMMLDGVIDSYGIGGAIGATYYVEPVATIDIDVFVSMEPAAGSTLVTLQPIYDHLKGNGAVVKGEYIVIAGWPVQFLPPPGPLGEEAIAEAITADIEGEPARIFTAEHLAALALQTGRAKDKSRLLQFIEAQCLDMRRFENVLQNHNLLEKWREFERQFLQP